MRLKETDMRLVETDVLIIGSGAAGLTASVYAAELGVNVLVVDKGIVGRSGSSVSAVQIAAAGRWSSEGDNVNSYYQDIIESGRGLSNPKLVHILANELEGSIKALVQWGLNIDKNNDGQVLITTTSGHSKPRSISARKGNTGLGILNTLIRKANQMPNVKRWNHIFRLRLLTNNGFIVGVLALDWQNNQFITIQSKAVIIATGGIGQLYPMTSNPVQSTGDGFALALQAGCKLIDMEQIQFYPVSLALPQTLKGFCLSFYPVAKLLNTQHQRFMLTYDPYHLENITRDQLSFYITKEIREGRGTTNGGVYLDATESIDYIQDWFPHEYSLCLKQGLDLKTELAEVAPAAHFIMGGVQVNDTSSTDISGLFVIGETAGGIHGGNRLGNNALSECVVFGARAGDMAAAYCRQQIKFNEINNDKINWLKEHYEACFHTTTGTYRPFEMKDRIRNILWNHAGVIRDKNGLLKAQKELVQVNQDLAANIHMISSSRKLNRDVLDFLEAEKMIVTAQAIIGSALLREESRGAHYRLDYPQASSSVEHTTVRFENGQFSFKTFEKNH